MIGYIHKILFYYEKLVLVRLNACLSKGRRKYFRNEQNGMWLDAWGKAKGHFCNISVWN